MFIRDSSVWLNDFCMVVIFIFNDFYVLVVVNIELGLGLVYMLVELIFGGYVLKCICLFVVLLVCDDCSDLLIKGFDVVGFGGCIFIGVSG